MESKLKAYLESCVDVSSIESLCKSITSIGPYVSGLSLTDAITPEHLKRYSYVRTRKNMYRQFHIPKKSGGKRTITAPDGILKDIMHTLCFMLNTIYLPTSAAMAFVPQRSIVDNARKHVGKNYVLNIDLKDFFTSIDAIMVENAMNKIGISPHVSRLLATICTYPEKTDNDGIVNIVPQGAPTSPVISNICAMTLDARLTGLAKRFGLDYTRYADDITFSSNHNVYDEEGVFWNELKKIVTESRFRINEKKTRCLKNDERQEVTGLTVDKKVNVSRKYIKNLRAQIHQIGLQEIASAHEVNVARGKLYFLRMVKGADDSTFQKLCTLLNIALAGKRIE